MKGWIFSLDNLHMMMGHWKKILQMLKKLKYLVILVDWNGPA